MKTEAESELKLALEGLSEIEKNAYKLIRKVKEIQPRNMPDKRMVGAIARLKDKGLVEIYKKYTSIFRRKKKKFVRAKDSSQNLNRGKAPAEK